FQLLQNYPNPFNPSTSIQYSVGTINNKLTHVELSIYNILGEKIVTLVSGNQPAGAYSVKWNAGKFPSGVYFYRLQAGDFVQTRRMLLIK
ncbi:MAG: T9SS type A sorting domain-containing protein, partial [Calditrichaceae bacterium]